ncbi:MAG: 3-oxoadipate enol-lactonase [Acidisphaera sp.]|nr:3-oxoadipate enol-lactonase [Acidisphaera sp.]
MFLRLSDLSVHVQLDGPRAAPALLLLHSLGTALHVWDGQVEALSRSFCVIRPDLRGHGLTGVTPGPYTIEGLARDALAVLDALGIGTAHVAGLSIGGMIAQSLAAQAPGRVASLILCDTAMAIPPPELWRERAATVRASGMAVLADAVMARWVTPGFMQAPEAHGLRAMLLRTDPEGYAGAAEAIAVADLSAQTAALRVPTLILVGEQDEATPPASAEAMRRAIPGAVLEPIAGAAHIPTVERPDAVAEAMLRFLAPAIADPYEAGMTVRRQVLGAEHVARATAAITDLDRDFQRFITSTAWGAVWTRPHFDRRTRSLLTLGLMAALGHHEEFRLHVRATANTGATAADIAELLIHVAAYAGIPAANSAVRIAKETLREMGSA